MAHGVHWVRGVRRVVAAFASCSLLALTGCATTGKEPAAASAKPVATQNAWPVGDSDAALPAAVVRQGELSLQLAKKLGAAKTATRAQLQAYYRKVFPAIEVRIDAGIRCKDHRGATGAFDRFFAATGLDRPAR